jgi:TM2 domain-containing membrane protein YozV
VTLQVRRVMIAAMSNALVKHRSPASGLVPAVASALLPGLGQLVNRQVDKGLGVMVTYVVAGAGFIGALPLLGWVAGLVASATWVYAVVDGYVQGRKK